MRRRDVVRLFVHSAVSGDETNFLRAMLQIDWPGAWLDIFDLVQVVPREAISDDVRRRFLVSWRGTRDVDPNGPWADEAPIGIDWTLTQDLEGNLDLLVRCLKILMPCRNVPEPPLALFRGQSLPAHEAGTYGVWWTTLPLFAESFARGPFRAEAGQGAVVVAIDPSVAIIHRLNAVEYLLDPSKLTDVRLVDVPPRNTPAEAAMTQWERDARSRVLGVPSGNDTARVREWIERGTPLAGLGHCREERAAYIAEKLAA